MAQPRRPSLQTRAVLHALASEPAEWRYGYELGRQVGLKAGSLYPILVRLADRNLLESRWEEPLAGTPGRPPRHLYRLTSAGADMAHALKTAPATAPRRLRPEPRSAS